MYTKGEWTCHPIDGTEGRVWDAETTETVIATVSLSYDTLENTSQTEANAHLIASAPDMYEALKEIEHLCSGSAFRQDTDQQIIAGKCFSALAKAEGK